MSMTYADFVKKYPAYASTISLDELRASDYSRLDHAGQIYLDYTGGGLYADSQVRQHQQMLLEGVFGNPHSSNPTSQAATKLIDSARASVLKFFNADPDEYDVIFTQNASGALKVVGEAYPFGPGDQYLLTFDNHNSVNGIREFARAKGARVTYAPVIPPDMRIDDELHGFAGQFVGHLEVLSLVGHRAVLAHFALHAVVKDRIQLGRLLAQQADVRQVLLVAGQRGLAVQSVMGRAMIDLFDPGP
jgi:selenocysteine lyase/cysteine desulfurase